VNIFHISEIPKDICILWVGGGGVEGDGVLNLYICVSLRMEIRQFALRSVVGMERTDHLRVIRLLW